MRAIALILAGVLAGASAPTPPPATPPTTPPATPSAPSAPSAVPPRTPRTSPSVVAPGAGKSRGAANAPADAGKAGRTAAPRPRPTGDRSAAGPRRSPAPTDATGKTLAPEQVDSLIEVAEDLSPEWAQWLRTRRASDPESLGSAIQTHGRRLIALAVLREQSPDLYELKVAELRLQSEVGDIGRQYREALAAGRAEEAATLLKTLREKTAQQVDKSLKARAAELAALDQQVKELQRRLLEDSTRRDARIEELLKSLTAPGSGEPFLPPPGGQPPASNP